MALLFSLLYLAAAVWVLYEVWAKNNRFTDTEKLIWTIGAILFSLITAVVYYLTRRKQEPPY